MLNILLIFFLFVIIVLVIIVFVLIRKQRLGHTKKTKNDELPALIEKNILEVGCAIMEHSSDAFADESAMVRLLDFINTTLIRLTVADGGAILLVDDFEDLVRVKAFSGEFPPPYKLPADLPRKVLQIETHFRNAHFSLTDNILGKIVKSGIAELIVSPNSDERIHKNTSNEYTASTHATEIHQAMKADFLQASSYIFIPLKLKDSVVGLVALARKKNSRVFTVDNFDLAKTVSHFASIAVKNIYSFQEIIEYNDLTREAKIAVDLQTALYLKKIPTIPHMSLGNFFNTAEGVCSDYFDIILARKDRTTFVFADVPGKGMTSLIIMSMIRAIMRVIVNTTQTAGTILGWTNRGIAPEKVVDHFASVALLNYDSTTQTIQFATAGTAPILHFSAEHATWKKISIESEPIGVEKTTEYLDCKLKLAKNDILVLYTDGLIESLDDHGNQYSSERLKKIITKYASLRGNDIANKVKNDLRHFTGSIAQHDDQSLLIMQMQ